MKYKAVVFDLFGTLVNSASLQERRRRLSQIASALSIDSDTFAELWSDTSNQRIMGIWKYRENVKYILRKAGVPIDDARIELATKIRFDMIKSEIVPRKDAEKVLSTLKSEGYKIGLISDCTHEATVIWESTPFPQLIDVTVFSCLVGLRKPDPRIYQVALDQLKVESQNCLYIGDGGSQELTGASQVGMNPVLFRLPEDERPDVYRVNDEADAWHGPVVSSLMEVLTLLKE